ncbi:MAG TPA: hypothetical protein VMI33_04265 [Streptosporangiaceae bacterium]|nr:hypothetical protein [Streptosporangiaceae bacterium]
MASRPVTTVGAGDPIALGAVTRTGSVTLIAVAKVNGRAAFAGRWEEPLVPSGLPAQPYHAAAYLDAAAAEDMVGRGEQAAEEAAMAALGAATAGLRTAAGPGVSAAGPGVPAGSRPAAADIVGVAVVVKAVSVPGSVATVLRSHAWMHAAEGVLYRDAVLAAARRCGLRAHAVDAATLPEADDILRDLGRDAGRPWRRIEKDAARAALTLLSPAGA